MTGLSWRETETNITSEPPPPVLAADLLHTIKTVSVHRVCTDLSRGKFLSTTVPLQQTVVVSVGSYDDIFVCFYNGKIPLSWTHAQAARLKAQLWRGAGSRWRVENTELRWNLSRRWLKLLGTGLCQNRPLGLGLGLGFYSFSSIHQASQAYGCVIAAHTCDFKPASYLGTPFV